MFQHPQDANFKRKNSTPDNELPQKKLEPSPDNRYLSDDTDDLPNFFAVAFDDVKQEEEAAPQIPGQTDVTEFLAQTEAEATTAEPEILPNDTPIMMSEEAQEEADALLDDLFGDTLDDEEANEAIDELFESVKEAEEEIAEATAEPEMVEPEVEYAEEQTDEPIIMVAEEPAAEETADEESVNVGAAPEMVEAESHDVVVKPVFDSSETISQDGEMEAVAPPDPLLGLTLYEEYPEKETTPENKEENVTTMPDLHDTNPVEDPTEPIAAASADSQPPSADVREETWNTSEDDTADRLEAYRMPVDGGRPNIRVIGVGGGGTNSVTSMLRLGLEGVDFLIVNTDSQALSASPCELKLQIGDELTRGLGAGSKPEIGKAAAEASRDEIRGFLEDADMVFITAGMGGGTGTGAAPIIAEIARELGVLSVGVCTKPFGFEGKRRVEQAELGLKELRERVDTMIVVSNQKLLDAVGPEIPIQEAFELANSVLAQGVGAISELVSVPGLINVDFADVRTILSDSGDAVMGIGRAKGEQRATAAVNKACTSPLLEKLAIEGASGILICIHGGPDLTLHEVNAAATVVNRSACTNANIIFGAVVDEEMKEEEIKVTVLATGFKTAEQQPVVDPTAASREMLGLAAGRPTEESLAVGLPPELQNLLKSAEVSQSGVANPSVESPMDDDSNANGNGKHESDLEWEDDDYSLANAGADADDQEIPAYKRYRRRRTKGRFF
jgi:cell division protein FtsZ